MQADDFDGFQTVIREVHDFYGKDISSFALDVWWQTLRHFDLIAIRDAFGRHTLNPDNGQFLPRPADVVRMLEGSTLDSAVTAWTKVDYGVRVIGTYATVVFDDALIHRVVEDMGGWPQLGRKSTDEWPFVAKEFQTRYRGYKTRRASGTYPPKLIGLFDQQNSQHGYLEQEPVLIGEADTAQRVLAGGSNQPMLPITRLLELRQDVEDAA